MVLLHPDSGTDYRQSFCRDHSSDKSSKLKTFKRVPLDLDFCTTCIFEYWRQFFPHFLQNRQSQLSQLKDILKEFSSSNQHGLQYYQE